jgi:hypothetical protein
MTVLTFRYSIGPDTRLTFNDKPDAAIRGLLKGAGFRWAPAGGFWWRRGVKGAADFIGALQRRIGPRTPDGACWTCSAPDGFFRPEGAATPVFCDECHKAHRDQQGAQTSRGRAYDDPMGVDRAFEDQCRDQCGL